MRPMSAQQAIVLPSCKNVLPEPRSDEPLFSGAERTWYLAFVEGWANFEESAIEFWNSQPVRNAFDELKGHPIVPPRTADAQLIARGDGAEILADHFQREVLEVVEGVCNKLLKTGESCIGMNAGSTWTYLASQLLETMKESDVPESVFLSRRGSRKQGMRVEPQVRCSREDGGRRRRNQAHRPRRVSWRPIAGSDMGDTRAGQELVGQSALRSGWVLFFDAGAVSQYK